MSGGGAFGEDGAYLGILVRATEDGPERGGFTRVVRAEHVLAELARATGASPASGDGGAAAAPPPYNPE